MRSRLTLGNVTNLLMAITLLVALWKLFHVPGHAVAGYKPGDKIANSIWNTMPDAKSTLIIVDRTDCGFCRASMPFYGRLTVAAKQAGVEVISVTPDDPAAHARYLQDNQVRVERTVSLKDTPLNVTGTPTLIMLDAKKIVTAAWVGQLSSEQEASVLSSLH